MDMGYRRGDESPVRTWGAMGINGCRICLEKQRRIDVLEEELKQLRAKQRLLERKEQDGFFGSSTPSSQRPIKPNSEQKEKKPKGARPGHKGNGRKSHEGDIDYTIEVEAPEFCPECGLILMRFHAYVRCRLRISRS
jgi:transposase